MHNENYILGIDTSNYTTSLAVTNKLGEIVIDYRKPLIVKQGERGLRQSYALFQHMENLPNMILELFNKIDKNKIAAVSVSDKPRPLKDSYMPVFLCGVNYGKIIAASLSIPFFKFSHQEGHLQAIKNYSPLNGSNKFLAYHLSGGTCELLKVSMLGNNFDKIEIIGGSKDISFGQLIDRVGVAMGFSFPAGKALDEKALKYKSQLLIDNTKQNKILSPIALNGLYINLSGIETQCQRNIDNSILSFELFTKISNCLCKLSEKAVKETGINQIMFAGGVSASKFIKEEIEKYFNNKKITLAFGNPKLSSDNAVGISLLGGKSLWQ
ncbi:tRNA (adenosine(37)-N6)-threonylcarbamoyltransferase complex transferase subunit TsaD [Anaerovorax odorimutans]|uniref:hypothetical protein n=1 Tax=Anaerovorax odorimutans TaxID=109327 RepID=UPI00040FF15C|nr:hypothetical protein [Anaerovorax odorimutans]